MRDETHIGTDRCLLRHHIAGVRAGAHRERDRRLQHGARLRGNPRHHPDKQGLEKPQIAEYQTQTERPVRCQCPEHGLYFFGHLSPERRVVFHIVHKIRESRDWTVGRRCTRVSAAAARRERHVSLSLLKYADHGKISVNSADRIRDDTAAFITDKVRPDAAPLQFCDKLRAAVAGPLLRAGGRQIDILPRRDACLKHLLHRLKEPHDRAFCIRCTSAPDLAVRDIAGKWRVLPCALRGHDILMAHQYKRLVVFCPFPEQQEVAVDVRDFQLLEHPGKQLPEKPVESLDLRHIMLLRIGHRLILHHFGENPCVLFSPCARLCGIVRFIG